MESVASYLVDGMLVIILQVRSEQNAACVSLVVMIPKLKAYDYSEHLDVTAPSEVSLDTLISLKTRKDGMLTLLCWN